MEEAKAAGAAGSMDALQDAADHSWLRDLEKDPEISSVKFSSTLLDTFDELGREFILAHGQVEFV